MIQEALGVAFCFSVGACAVGHSLADERNEHRLGEVGKSKVKFHGTVSFKFASNL